MPCLALHDRMTQFDFDPDEFLLLAGDDRSLKVRGTLTGVLWEWQGFRGDDDSNIGLERIENDRRMFFLGDLAIQPTAFRRWDPTPLAGLPTGPWIPTILASSTRVDRSGPVPP